MSNADYHPYNPLAWIVGKPTIGENTWIGAFTLIDSLHDHLAIGKGCNISSGAQILTHTTISRCVSERTYNHVDHAPTIIEDYCFIGTHATILMGAKIGHHSVIGAGAVVLEHAVIPPYSVVTGIPGKVTGDAHKFLKTEKA